MQPLEITVFLDGRPGHEKQTTGILTALARLTSLNVTTCKVPIKSLSGSIFDWVSFFFKRWLSKSLREGKRQENLMIGTGSHTHLAMLLHTDRDISRVVTCMTPARCFLSDFDLCFVPEHDMIAQKDNILITTGPPNPCYNKRVHDPENGLIVVGGIDEKSHSWDSITIVRQIECIISREKHIRWALSSSPRTPPDCVDLLQKMIGKLHNEKNHEVSFYPFTETKPGWIEKKYDECSLVWVTADSMSMIFEALTAGCKVGVVPVVWKNEENKFVQSIDSLRAQNRIVEYENWNKLHEIGKQQEVDFPPLDEASRCAKEILKRWWPDRLL